MFSHRTGKGYTDRDSPYCGVYRIRESRKWEARLDHVGLPTIYLGTYYTAEDAARAHDIVAIKLKGWDAITNFDLNNYNVGDIMKSEITQTMDGSVILQKVGSNAETATNPQSQSSSQCQHNPQQLSNSSFSHGFQNPNLISSIPYTLGGFTASAGSSGNSNSIGNHGGVFLSQSATLQQPLQTQSQMNVNNVFNQTLFNNNNNQFLPQSSNFPLLAHGTQNLELEKCLRLPDWPASFGKKLLGGNLELEPLSKIAALNMQSLTHGMVNEGTRATNGVCSFGSQIHPMPPSNQEFGATQLQFPGVNQSYEHNNFQANTSNQKPHQNLNSCFSDGFQNPISEPNNNGSQSQATGSQIDLDVRDYLNILLEDNDLGCEFDLFAATNGGRQGL